MISYAQKYITIPKINIFKKSENNLKFQKKNLCTTKKKNLSSQDTYSHSIVGTKRSYDFHITDTSCESSKGLQHQNYLNKRLKSSEGSSTSKVVLSTPPSSLSSDFRNSDDSRPTPLSSQLDLASSSTQRMIPLLHQSDNSHCSSNTKLKGKIMDTSQHERRSVQQSEVQKTSEISPDSSEKTKTWTRSQTPEQQLEIMKYWLDKYHKQNRFDPAISDLTSGKPWNEIEGKLLSRFMPIFKKFLSDNGISPRITEFYFLFFTALRDKHKLVNNVSDDDDCC
ncbi:hypothetical protein RclHR1_01060014 [Rhizophagus clarus]|uniref:Uncharacterized protein n=1 Tax=Rhizophagus clarus TaxID=94130 RepID=A0A2Z6Q201_9GLOM|nr:hypothetical protein RclHR1_01060014 [Rhizophagus clarus]